MHRFQYILCCGSTGKDWLRIELKKISIHLMLWFNYGGRIDTFAAVGFQYILCCGSTFLLKTSISDHHQFQYILCCGSTPVARNKSITVLSISIHLMLWFNKDYPNNVNIKIQDFNTSYVVVQQL